MDKIKKTKKCGTVPDTKCPEIININNLCKSAKKCPHDQPTFTFPFSETDALLKSRYIGLPYRRNSSTNETVLLKYKFQIFQYLCTRVFNYNK